MVALLASLGLSAQKSSDMENRKVKIEVWSDVVCPFCYLGKKKMEKAIAKLGAGEFVEVEWKSFQLDPDFSEGEAILSTPYLAERKGYPVAQIEQMCGQLEAQGKGYGIDFNFDKALTFNTFDAHRLIQWAKTEDRSHELKEAMMLAYFTNGVDLSKMENVLRIVEGIGLDGAEAKTVLLGEQFGEQVERDIYESRQIGVRGVPFFLVDQRGVISGAQDDKVFEKAILAALKKHDIVYSEAKGVCVPGEECR